MTLRLNNLTAFGNDYSTMVSNVRTALPSAKIICRGIFPRTLTNGSGQTRLDYNAKIATAAGAAGANVSYRSTDNAFDPNDTSNLPDGVHLSAKAYATWAPVQNALLGYNPLTGTAAAASGSVASDTAGSRVVRSVSILTDSAGSRVSN